MTTVSGHPLPCPADKLVPHEKPMLLVDRLIQVADKDDPESCSIVEATTPEEGLFVENKTILPEYLVELMAQAVASVDGYENSRAHKQPDKGFLAAIDDFTLSGKLITGVKLRVELRKTLSFDPVFLFTGSIYVHDTDTLLARGQLKIWKENHQS